MGAGGHLASCFYCSGCNKGGLFNKLHVPGHFVYRTRFSRTSGKSFLLPQGRSDVLYVSDPCEHLDQGEDGDIGFFRGMFKSFSMSKVRKLLINRGARLHPTEVCPYCKAKLWSMQKAKMIPQSASCRLGAYEDCIDYFVCLNGHMFGVCTLCLCLNLKRPLNWSDDEIKYRCCILLLRYQRALILNAIHLESLGLRIYL